MIKTKEMDKFIKECMKLYLQNPNINITSDTFYRSLETYGFTRNEFENGYIRDIFPSLENYFSNSNLHVYVDQRQSGFLQLTSHTGGTKSVKMYLSFPKEYMEQATKKIFKFVADNNMSCGSKIAQNIRSDSIVIRLHNPNDAKMIMDFINHDRELNKYHKSTNPFSLKEGIVGVGYDDMLSYNSVLSELLASYFNTLKTNDNLKKANLKGFSSYVDEFYNKTFITKENLVEFTYTDMYRKFLYRLSNPGRLLNNFEQIIRVIKNVTSNDMDKNMFFNMYERFNNDQPNIDYFNQEYDKQLYNIQINVLNSYIHLAITKYGLDKVHLYLDSYIQGNDNAITSDNNFRFNFKKYLRYEDVQRIVMGNTKQYVENYINSMSINSNIDSNYYLFISACVATAKKYGNKQAIVAIKNSINGNYSYFFSISTIIPALASHVFSSASFFSIS